MKNRGQESAPFEVLISVIIMGFVIVIAFTAMNVLMEEQCKAEIKRSGSELKSKVQEVVKGTDTQLNFFPPGCFDQKKESIKLRVLNSEPLCNYYCGGTKRECLLFEYDAVDWRELICLESASVLTQFLTSSPCQDRDGYKLVNFKDSIPRGAYTLVNKSGNNSAFPNICAYVRER
ncbi:MAG: hypothetical protein J4215_02545 [Candidatus Diapherotrites archaeon]|uniref:Uncharacterized protein n=1 Tax=Candidatus Iainarchaeum sp. TaxID=3101447 RepID=A0A8T4L7D8_9ARCH|nr:hypothetical protein [Candidatus Diapherotrites archaeon]